MCNSVLFDGKTDLEEWLFPMTLQRDKSFPETSRSGKEIDYGNWHRGESAGLFYAACLIKDSAGMPSPLCSFQAMARVSGRLWLSTSYTRFGRPM